MAHTQIVKDWSSPIRFLPFIEKRTIGAFLDTNPNVPLDLVPFWSEYRLNLADRKGEQDMKIEAGTEWTDEPADEAIPIRDAPRVGAGGVWA